MPCASFPKSTNRLHGPESRRQEPASAAIGAGGLGEFIFRGLAMVDNRVILEGAIPAAILALAADVGFGLLERRLRYPQ